MDTHRHALLSQPKLLEAYMRSFGSLALKQVRSRRARSLLTAAGIVLGVGMILGVLLLSATINRTFTDLYDSVYGKADLIVSGGGGRTRCRSARSARSRARRASRRRSGGSRASSRSSRTTAARRPTPRSS